MHRTTIMLPGDLKARAARCAERRGVSLGEFIRESLVAATDETAGDATTDPFLDDGIVFDGPAPKDLSRHHDDYLYGPSHADRSPRAEPPARGNGRKR